MFGNRPILEPHFKTVARMKMRATFFGYTVFDMVLLLFFLSIFTLSIPKVNVITTSKIEKLYEIKKIIETKDYICHNQLVLIEGKSLNDVTCRISLTYVRFSYEGYIFYEDKRI